MNLTKPIMSALAQFVPTRSHAPQLKLSFRGCSTTQGQSRRDRCGNHQPADEDRACMKPLLIPEARMMFVSLGAGRSAK